MALQWRQAGLPRVDRRPPLVTAGQKSTTSTRSEPR